jgi:hypothetical protein
VLVCPKAVSPSTLPGTSTGSPKVFPDFIMVCSPIVSDAPVFQTSTRYD